MSLSSAAASRQRRTARSVASADVRERWIRRRIGIAWGLLVLDVLTFAPGQSVLPIPGLIGKALTQGALPVALLVALSLNRKIVIRPNIFLCLLSLLVIEALITSSMEADSLRSTVYRTFRLGEFVAVLWLLSPWWGRRDLLLVRCHLIAMWTVLCSVLIGLVVSPGRAMAGGRLVGALWPIPPTQVAHYAAVTLGLTVVLWLCGYRRGRFALLVLVVAGLVLVLTHTRTALLGLVAGILIAGLSLIVAKARVRKLFATAGTLAAIAIITLSSFLTTWLARGEGTKELSNLSGRTAVWSALLNFPRDRFQEIFGFGLSNDGFNGLSIDSSWLASYQEQGLFGVVVYAAVLLFLLVTAYFQPRGVQRALALFLVTYCLLASFTEVGITNPTPYVLDLTVAASMLVPSAANSRPT